MATTMAINLYSLMVAAAVIFLAAAAAAQQQPPACASKLISCANYLNSTKPPESCCGPLKEAVKNELPCLCSIFNAPDLLKAFNVNLTQALELPKHCGVTSGQGNLCSKSAATPSSSKTPSAGGSGSSDTGSSGNTAKSNKSGAFGVPKTWIGMPSLVACFLFTWSVMAL